MQYYSKLVSYSQFSSSANQDASTGALDSETNGGSRMQLLPTMFLAGGRKAWAPENCSSTPLRETSWRAFLLEGLIWRPPFSLPALTADLRYGS